jgi:hypothetical protein
MSHYPQCSQQGNNYYQNSQNGSHNITSQIWANISAATRLNYATDPDLVAMLFYLGWQPLALHSGMGSVPSA